MPLEKWGCEIRRMGSSIMTSLLLPKWLELIHEIFLPAQYVLYLCTLMNKPLYSECRAGRGVRPSPQMANESARGAPPIPLSELNDLTLLIRLITKITAKAGSALMHVSQSGGFRVSECAKI
jgi:hypothetical protein